MSESEQQSRSNIDTMLQHIYINEIIFIGLIVLSFLGDVIGDVSERLVIFYWILMLPVFFAATIVIEKASSFEHETDLDKERRKDGNHYIKFEVILWLAAFFASMLVMLLWHAEIIRAGATGYVIHIILAQTMFASGLILGMRFYLIGLFLFALAGVSMTMQGMVGVTFMLTLPFIALGLYMEKHYFFPIMKRSYNRAHHGDS